MTVRESTSGRDLRWLSAFPLDLDPKIDTWLVPKLAVALLVPLYWLTPLGHTIVGLPLLPLAVLTLVGYLAAIVWIDWLVEGVIAGVLALSTSAASVTLIYAKTSRANLTANVADPFVGLFLVLFGVWIYQGQRERPGGLAVIVAGLAWVSWAALAAVFGAGPSSETAAFFAIDQLRWVVYFLAGLCLFSVISLRAAAVTVAIGGVLHAPVAIVQSFIVGPQGVNQLGAGVKFEDMPTTTLFGHTFENGYPISGFAGSSVAFATIAFISIVVCVLYLVRGNARQRAASAISLPVVFAALFLTRSDGIWVGTAVVLVGSLLTVWRHRLPRPVQDGIGDRPRTIAVGCVTALSLLSVGVLAVGVERVLSMIPVIQGDNFAPRARQYQGGLEAAQNYPLFGLGGSNFELVAADYGLERPNAIHNTFIEFLSGTGFVGLLLYLVLLSALAVYVVHAINNQSVDRTVALLLCVCAVGFGVLSMLNLIWPRQTSNSVYWLLAGMVVTSTVDR